MPFTDIRDLFYLQSRKYFLKWPLKNKPWTVEMAAMKKEASFISYQKNKKNGDFIIK